MGYGRSTFSPGGFSQSCLPSGIHPNPFAADLYPNRFFSEGNIVKNVRYRSVKPFHYSVGLGGTGLCFGMIHILDCQKQLVIMALEKGHYLVVEKIRCCNGSLHFIEFGKRDFS